MFSNFPLFGPNKAISYSEGQQVKSRNIKDLIIPNRCENLLKLRNDNLSDLSLINHKLIHTISDLEVLRLAYELIKSKPGNMTPGVNSETLDGISNEYLVKVSEKLKRGQFKFSPARRIWIPKPGKVEKRPLAIASPREKVVQKAIELVLSSIYEPSFLNYSHGFRPGRNTHSALRMVDAQCKGATWFIEVDITKCFDTISHDHLMAILSRRITCQKTLALIRSALKAGYIELGGVSAKAQVGTPQGSVLSPLLCNIFLHELDCFIMNLIGRTDKGSKRRQNSAYTAVLNRMARLDLEGKKILRKELRTHSSRDFMDREFIRVRYVRYADDFLISVIGPYSLAVSIKNEVAQFLEKELRLTLNKAKTLLSKAKAYFLGTEVTWRRTLEKLVILTKAGRKSRVTGRMSLHAPITKLLSRLHEKGFIKWTPQGKAVPTSVGWLQNMDHADILRYYNAVARGILNYYSFSDNRSSLGGIIRLLHMSCARTFAIKYKLRFMSKAFGRFGRKLACPKTGTEFYFPETFKRIRKFNVQAPLSLEMLHRTWHNKLTKSSLDLECVICGISPVQMHHVRKIRELKHRLHLSWFTIQMAAINRKQVPLCADHHNRLHQNLLTQNERDLFKKRLKNFIKNKHSIE